MDHNYTDWLILGILGFGGGIAANIVIPNRRGVWGFLGAAVVGVFSGGTAGMSAHAFELHPGWQYLIAGSTGVLGYPLLGLLRSIKIGTGGATVNTTINGTVQQNIAQQGGDAGVNCDD